MRRIVLLALFVSFATGLFAQKEKAIQRSWIKTSIENLSATETGPDTIYARYTFSKSALNISFYPGWNDYSRQWSLKGDGLTIGFDTYTIEELNDTALVIALEGFRLIRFLSEEYLSGQEAYLQPVGTYRDQPLFRANDYITPRHKGKESFRKQVEKAVEGYNIKKANYFLATFIVTETGTVENVIIHKGITEGFDMAVRNTLLKSSKDWIPARYKGKPIQTEMKYEIRYLDSFRPY